MWSKRNRLTVCVQIFEDLYWQDIPEKENHLEFSKSELEDLIPGEKTDQIDYKLVQKALKQYQKLGEGHFQEVFTEYMDNWSKTLLSVRAVLYCWVLESEMTGVDKAELVGKYIKLTQDLIAGGNTGLVHALLSKVSGTYHEAEQPEKTDDHK